jgi:hypothetical protein
VFNLISEKVTINYNDVNKNWILSNNKFKAQIPCEFPKELLKEGKIITIDGKAFEPDGKAQSTVYEICIKKIY